LSGAARSRGDAPFGPSLGLRLARRAHSPHSNQAQTELGGRVDRFGPVPGFGMRHCTCAVRTTFAESGDGFAVLRVAQKDGGGPWRLACTFDREPEGVSRHRPLEYEL
jgi:hypothetical protein